MSISLSVAGVLLVVSLASVFLFPGIKDPYGGLVENLSCPCTKVPKSSGIRDGKVIAAVLTHWPDMQASVILPSLEISGARLKEFRAAEPVGGEGQHSIVVEGSHAQIGKFIELFIRQMSGINGCPTTIKISS